MPKQNFTKSEVNTRPSNTSRPRKRLIPKSHKHAPKTSKNRLKNDLLEGIAREVLRLVWL